MMYLQHIDGNNKPVFTTERKKAYPVEYKGNADMIAQLLGMVYKGTTFTAEIEDPEGYTGMFIIVCSPVKLRVSKIRKLFSWNM